MYLRLTIEMWLLAFGLIGDASLTGGDPDETEVDPDF